MNFGQKIISLKDSMGFKNFQEFGKAIGYEGKEPGNWLSDISKKENLQTIDVSKLQKLCNYCNVNLDWLLNNNENNKKIINDNLKDSDIGGMLENIQKKLKDQDNTFYGFSLNKESSKLIEDSIEIIKDMIKNNL